MKAMRQRGILGLVLGVLLITGIVYTVIHFWVNYSSSITANDIDR